MNKFLNKSNANHCQSTQNQHQTGLGHQNQHSFNGHHRSARLDRHARVCCVDLVLEEQI